MNEPESEQGTSLSEKELSRGSSDGIQISEEDFSKLSYHQRSVVLKYEHLLSRADAEKVVDMLGDLVPKKKILDFCQANGKRVFSVGTKPIEKRSDTFSKNTVKYWPLIGLLAGLIPGLIVYFLTRGTQLDVYNTLIGLVGIVGGFVGASLGQTKTTVWVAAILTSILGIFLLLIILGSLCAFCM